MKYEQEQKASVIKTFRKELSPKRMYGNVSKLVYHIRIVFIAATQR